MECPICYQAISLEDEAFVGTCYHRFCHKCISEWTAQQSKHPITETGKPEHRCPMCKQTYTYVLYDCVLNSYRVEYVDEEARRRSGAVVGRGAGSFLTAGHRRRRALYMEPQGSHGQAQQCSGAAVSALPASQQPTTGLSSGRRAPMTPAVVRGPDDSELRAFVERELQAVLLQEDVALVLQHVLGVLRGLMGGNGGGSRSSGPGRSGITRSLPQAKRPRLAPGRLPDQEDFTNAMSRELASFLRNDSGRFAQELYLFLRAGLNVRAYDTFVFGPEVAPEARPASTPTDRTGAGERNESLHRATGASAGDYIDIAHSSDDEGDDFAET